MTKIDREKIYKKTHWRCWYCWEKIDFKQMQVDHIIPQRNYKQHIIHKDFWVPYFLQHLWDNDLNHYDNLLATCRSCNHYKTSMFLEDFRKELWLQIERLNKNSNYKLACRYWLIKETNKPIEFYFEKKEIYK